MWTEWHSHSDNRALKFIKELIEFQDIMWEKLLNCDERIRSISIDAPKSQFDIIYVRFLQFDDLSGMDGPLPGMVSGLGLCKLITCC